MVEYRDSTAQDFELLEILDSSLIVRSFETGTPAPESIPFSKINRVYHNINGKVGGGLLGCILGAGAGAAASSVLIQGTDGYSQLGRLILIVPVSLIGMFLGCAAAKDNKGFDLRDSNDVHWLKTFSLYPYFEPPELQKIR
jgi:hypothetical protein